jgi:5-formyltetrahydrofolate cyclo-ligase
MEMVLLRDWDDFASLPTTKWNIKQPAEDEARQEALSTERGLDLILMPGRKKHFGICQCDNIPPPPALGLAFTLDGRRCGRGKGYYDTYLEKCSSAMGAHRMPKTIALAFKEQIVSDIPTDAHDFLIDRIIFDDGTD